MAQEVTAYPQRTICLHWHRRPKQCRLRVRVILRLIFFVGVLHIPSLLIMRLVVKIVSTPCSRWRCSAVTASCPRSLLSNCSRARTSWPLTFRLDSQMRTLINHRRFQSSSSSAKRNSSINATINMSTWSNSYQKPRWTTCPQTQRTRMDLQLWPKLKRSAIS